jgi:hypothetical protein
MVINDRVVEDLIEPQGALCITIYMPTHRAGRETRQDRVRLKNLLQEAEERLVTRGQRRPEARRLLEPGGRLLDDNEFWQHQDESLALWLNHARQWRCPVPRRVEELVTIGRHFHITPILPLLAENRPFYILALSQNSVRLLRGGAESIEEVGVPGLIHSFEALQKFIDAERQLQFHTQTAGHGPGEARDAMMHGHGAGVDDRQLKKWLADYCRLIDKTISAFLSDSTEPLVLAATAPLDAMYRQTCTYRHLCSRTLEGSPDHLSPRELHERARPLLQSPPGGDEERIMEMYRAARRAAQGTEDLQQILVAAETGRIAHLLLWEAEHRWGRFENGQMSVHDTPGAEDEDLLNTAAVLTRRAGGQVHILPPAQMPVAPPVAAVFRY